ncbi:hypothetical protein, partial [Paraburkholderia sp. RL17-373-BIF-A]|uniref:hypothetical protein n=1 Tax=Paraburkholderia sp. RL17-373-BIF-A TaxID=3031629 RepID=UPI0038BCBDEC
PEHLFAKRGNVFFVRAPPEGVVRPAPEALTRSTLTEKSSGKRLCSHSRHDDPIDSSQVGQRRSFDEVDVQLLDRLRSRALSKFQRGRMVIHIAVTADCECVCMFSILREQLGFVRKTKRDYDTSDGARESAEAVPR